MSTALQPCLPRLNSKRIEKAQLRSGAKEFNKPNGVSIPGHKVNRKIFCTPHSLEEEFSALQSNESSEDDDETSPLERPPNSEELKALLADSERSKLVRKLSEANQQNRFLKRQLRVKEDALVNFKSELASTELEIRALVNLAQEIASYNIPKDSKKINGKYIQSHLLSRLEAVQEKLEAHIKDVDAAQSREVPLFWHGMAESVHVMGSFDGWSQGEHLSPEYVDSYTTFSTTLVLRPGRYEIKFLVDGEWQLSPEIPTIGEGFVQNNLLIIE
ncbi:5-AMP-activated protein kinase-related [Striga hermonthica]|uniref:5-AMP-activated protein kinase-related n=1 Tax=Striga hermonthica TaxID=68872 RepID=A0A9N7P0F7_STRHE|nr:5-AMP-activated protein kinase-related [Striga hermonthica]